MAPSSSDTAPTLAGRIQSILANSNTEQNNLLPVLHAIQDVAGFIPPDAVADIASAFNLSRAEVHGVITFYHHFRTTPPARHTVRICCAEACRSMGSEQLLAHAEKALGCGLHEKSANDQFSLQPIYCLGQCAASPAMMLDDALHARVTPEKFDRLVEQVKESA
jgi:formate dehydrogenase subunit gamma